MGLDKLWEKWFPRKKKWYAEQEDDGSIQLPFEAKLEGEEEDLGIDTYSRTWRFIEEWGAEELQRKREANDGISKDAIKTAVLRGEIRMLKRLIELPNSAGPGHHGIINHQLDDEMLEGEEDV